MERHRNDEIDAQVSEAGCMVPGPKPADALGERLAAVFHGQDRVAQGAVVRPEAEGRVEMKPIVPAARATSRGVGELSNGPGAAAAREVRIVGQVPSTVGTELRAAITKQGFTPGADARVDELPQTMDEVGKHG